MHLTFICLGKFQGDICCLFFRGSIHTVTDSWSVGYWLRCYCKKLILVVFCQYFPAVPSLSFFVWMILPPANLTSSCMTSLNLMLCKIKAMNPLISTNFTELLPCTLISDRDFLLETDDETDCHFGARATVMQLLCRIIEKGEQSHFPTLFFFSNLHLWSQVLDSNWKNKLLDTHS